MFSLFLVAAFSLLAPHSLAATPLCFTPLGGVAGSERFDVKINSAPLGTVRGIWVASRFPNEVTALHAALESPHPEQVAQGLATILGRYPTSRDVELLENTLRLFATVPGGYGPTAVKAILQGKSETLRDRPEFSMAADKKEFADNRLTLLAFGVERFLNSRARSAAEVSSLADTIGKIKADPRFAAREASVTRVKPSKKEFDAKAKSRIDLGVIGRKFAEELMRFEPGGGYPTRISGERLAESHLKRVQDKTSGAEVIVSYELNSDLYQNVRIPLKDKFPAPFPEESDILVAPHIRVVFDKSTAEVNRMEYYWRVLPRIYNSTRKHVENRPEIFIEAPELDPASTASVPPRDWEGYLNPAN